MTRLLFCCFCLLMLASCTFSTRTETSSSGSAFSGQELQSLDPDERLALAKKRKSYMTTIRKGDFYTLRNAPEEALNAYLTVAEKLPKDVVVRKKIAHVYFLLKNWSRSYSEYSQIPISELTDDERDELFRAMFFDETLFDRIGELSRYSIGSGALDYYKIVDTCYGGIHNCIVSIDTYSGSSEQVIALKNQIQNAAKISPAREYRNVMLAIKFYEQKMYRSSAKILEEVGKEFPDYAESKKILAFSYFALGNYSDAKKFLLEYLERNPKDVETMAKLGETYAFLSDPVSSNLYLNNAILSGYTPKTNLERRLAYNYSLLDDSVGMIKVLNYLLQEDDALENDFAVGISLSLEKGDIDRAKSWATRGLEKYPNSPVITPLFLSSLRLNGEASGALDILSGIPEEEKIKNPNYLLEEALLLQNIGHDDDAMKIFGEISRMEDWPDLMAEAQLQIARKNEQNTSPSEQKNGWW